MQGRNQGFFLGKQSQCVGIDWDRVKVSDNLGKAAALPALPLITPLTYYVGRSKIVDTIVYQ